MTRFKSGVPPLGIGASLFLFGTASISLVLVTQYLIPFLSGVTGQEYILFWFLGAGLCIFAPFLIVAQYLLHQEGKALNHKVWKGRLRFRSLSISDWFWGIGGIVTISLVTAGIIYLFQTIFGEINLHPPFMAFEPLTPGRYWLLAVWFPFWILNIMGEEILWRGVILPRQEAQFGRWAWLVNALGWLLFHLAFGVELLITLLPILFIVPYIVQRRKNTWLGVLIHAGLNGPGFIAIAFDLL